MARTCIHCIIHQHPDDIESMVRSSLRNANDTAATCWVSALSQWCQGDPQGIRTYVDQYGRDPGALASTLVYVTAFLMGMCPSLERVAVVECMAEFGRTFASHL